jgi:meiotic recombination protein REC8
MIRYCARLAATLGSRSTFKKLPKRSVLTADITQLCDLISEPAEPLALRLSSNLMFGVVRYERLLWPVLSYNVKNSLLFGRVYKG